MEKLKMLTNKELIEILNDTIQSNKHFGSEQWDIFSKLVSYKPHMKARLTNLLVRAILEDKVELYGHFRNLYEYTYASEKKHEAIKVKLRQAFDKVNIIIGNEDTSSEDMEKYLKYFEQLVKDIEFALFRKEYVLAEVQKEEKINNTNINRQTKYLRALLNQMLNKQRQKSTEKQIQFSSKMIEKMDTRDIFMLCVLQLKAKYSDFFKQQSVLIACNMNAEGNMSFLELYFNKKQIIRILIADDEIFIEILEEYILAISDSLYWIRKFLSNIKLTECEKNFFKTTLTVFEIIEIMERFIIEPRNGEKSIMQLIEEKEIKDIWNMFH